MPKTETYFPFKPNFHIRIKGVICHRKFIYILISTFCALVFNIWGDLTLISLYEVNRNTKLSTTNQFFFFSLHKQLFHSHRIYNFFTLTDVVVIFYSYSAQINK